MNQRSVALEKKKDWNSYLFGNNRSKFVIRYEREEMRSLSLTINPPSCQPYLDAVLATV